MNKDKDRSTRQRPRPKFFPSRALILAFIAIPILFPPSSAVAQSMGELLEAFNDVGEIRDFANDPGGYAKGKLKGAAKKWLKDAAFGPAMSAEMTAVFRRVSDKHGASPKGGACPLAAHGNAGAVLFDLKSSGTINWLPRTLLNSMETIVGQKWKEWIKDQAKDQVEAWLQEQFDGIPPNSYASKSTKSGCTYGVLATIDYKRGVYEVVIVADCKCQPLRIPLRKGHGVVAGWRLFASGKASVTHDDSFVKGKIEDVSRYEFSVGCNCAGDDTGVHMFDTPGLLVGGGADEETEDEVVVEDCNVMARLIAETEETLDQIRKTKRALSDNVDDEGEKEKSTLNDDLDARSREQQGLLQEYGTKWDPEDAPDGLLTPELDAYFRSALLRGGDGSYRGPNEAEQQQLDEKLKEAREEERRRKTREGGKKKRKEEEAKVSQLPAPPGSAVLTPQYAFAGGTITGTVTDEQGKPVTGAPVQVTTINGTVTETQTDEEGRFTSDVPAGGTDPLQVAVTGIVTAVTIALVSEIPSDIPAQPPAFVEPGQTVSINGDYPTVEMEPPPETAPPTPAEPVAETPGQPAQPAEPGQPTEPSGAEPASFDPRSLPVARAISADGTQAITSYRVPQDFIPGRSITVLTNSEGQTYRYETEMFRIVSASIDQDDLRSGQSTEFRYRFDFGPGPERDVWLTINTAGPITYASAGERQRLHINADGSAEFVGKLRAQRGGLTGTPFTINATIDR